MLNANSYLKKECFSDQGSQMYVSDSDRDRALSENGANLKMKTFILLTKMYFLLSELNIRVDEDLAGQPERGLSRVGQPTIQALVYKCDFTFGCG